MIFNFTELNNFGCQSKNFETIFSYLFDPVLPKRQIQDDIANFCRNEVSTYLWTPIFELSEAVLDYRFSEPEFIEATKLKRKTDEQFSKAMERVFFELNLKERSVKEDDEKKNLLTCLSCCLENRPKNKIYKYDQRLVKIIKLLDYWEQVDDELCQFIGQGVRELDKAGISGLTEAWSKLLEMGCFSDSEHFAIFRDVLNDELCFKKTVTGVHSITRLAFEYAPFTDIEKFILENLKLSDFRDKKKS